MSNYETLIFEENDGIAKISLNRPDNANAISIQLGRELLSAANYCSESETIRAVILTGTGKMFCTGGDIQAFAATEVTAGYVTKEMTGSLNAAIARLTRMNAPLIVAVNGAAAGAGFSLSLIGDIVLAAESAKFTPAYTALGVSPDGGGSYLLPRLVGLRKAQEIFLTNPMLTAKEAHELGMITNVVSNDQLMSAAEEMARQFAAGPRLAHGHIKRLMASSFNESLETQMELEAQGIAACISSSDGAEGIDAFLNRRKPAFKL